MYETIIESKDGYLGNFPATLQVGDTQSMTFTSECNGPFYMVKDNKISSCHDKYPGEFAEHTLKKEKKSE